ncbi:hypothetical protein DICPUDRAFT_93353 [Dictyostelium purpureum]|uniref:SHSP domain-containing protein n=1 Tax=Dictyostelium purpureum TaxID=5786 RepID=F1A682_DICPU|nr:uncharacterized protein DICPUDRAFT_93353 [Dictyostelium purpureum]EGC28296.1 hypothetical protein DICPUDRAFT_93353 [Dictyostelium purpureum]|eukprot:XP_003295176.1 hypothetical protein DICPUDRAFT_93353 [Dictyostelium purpureum]
MAAIFENLLNHHLNNNNHCYGESNNIGFAPDLDVVETSNSFIIETELAGVNKDDIQIEIKDSKLYIQGEKKRSASEASSEITETTKEADNQFKNKKYLSERSYGKFKRYLDLTSVLHLLDLSSIKTQFNDGLLTLTINKKNPELSKSIKILL